MPAETQLRLGRSYTARNATLSFCHRAARMVTSPISATVSRNVWNFKSHAQNYIQQFPQLVVRSISWLLSKCNTIELDELSAPWQVGFCAMKFAI